MLKDVEKQKAVILGFMRGEYPVRRACLMLRCHRSSFWRIRRRYAEGGSSSLVHGNTGRQSDRRVPDDQRQRILDLATGKYADCNFRFLWECLVQEGLHLSESWLRTFLNDHHVISPLAWRRTKRKEKRRRIQEQKQRGSDRPESSPAIAVAEYGHARRPRMAYAGELIQLDASLHNWFGPGYTHLHAAIDDATGVIVGAFFDTQETLQGYYYVLNQILTDYGIPYSLMTDRRTVFFYKNRQATVVQNTLTQFSYACHRLGIDLQCTSIPQRKGRIERLFGTLQRRLPQELRWHNITTIDEANQYLREVYIKKYNDRFAVGIDRLPSVFAAAPAQNDINTILSVAAPRSVDAGCSISWQGAKYRTYDRLGRPVYLPAGTKGLMIVALDGTLIYTAAGDYWILQKIDDRYPAEMDNNAYKQKLRDTAIAGWSSTAGHRGFDDVDYFTRFARSHSFGLPNSDCMDPAAADQYLPK